MSWSLPLFLSVAAGGGVFLVVSWLSGYRRLLTLPTLVRTSTMSSAFPGLVPGGSLATLLDVNGTVDK